MTQNLRVSPTEFQDAIANALRVLLRRHDVPKIPLRQKLAQVVRSGGRVGLIVTGDNERRGLHAHDFFGFGARSRVSIEQASATGNDHP